MNTVVSVCSILQDTWGGQDLWGVLTSDTDM